MRLRNPHLKPGQKQVVIVGGGFAGLAAAKELAGKDRAQVMLVDQRNHFLFQPLLYQVATAGLSPADIASPIRSELARAPNVEVHLGRVGSVALADRSIAGEDLDVQVEYDYLLIACGAQHSYFGKNDWEPFAPGLKTLEQAIEIRKRFLSAFEMAENELNPEEQRALLTFVVVGGGPTGVELAGAIAEISRTVLSRDFRRIRPESARVILLQAGPRVLEAFSEELSARAAKDLTELGVEVRISSRVDTVDAHGVEVGSSRIQARNVFWAAGVQTASLSRSLGVPLDKAGRIPVNSDLSLPGYPEVFAVGDIARFECPDGTVLPGLAQPAIQMGRAAARNILASIEGRPRSPFRYKDRGIMATIGKRKAILQAGKMKMAGYPAWLVWLVIHIMYLLGFRRRILVLLTLAWSYLFSKRGARLITDREWKLR